MWTYLSPLKSVSDNYKELKERELEEKQSCKSQIGFVSWIKTGEDDLTQHRNQPKQ